MKYFAECFTSTIELIFVVDGSESIGIDNFSLLKTWLINVTTTLVNKYGDGIRIEVMQYSDRDRVTSR